MNIQRKTLSSLMVGGMLSISCAIGVGHFALAQESLWKTLYESGCKALDSRQLKDAEKQLDSAMHEAESDANPEKLMTTIRKLVAVYEQQGRQDCAATLLKRLVELNEKTPNEKVLEYSQDMKQLALAYMRQGKLDEAEELYKKNLEYLQAKVGEQDAQYADLVQNYAILQLQRGKLSDSESLMKKALAIEEKQLKPEDPRIAVTLEALARVYSVAGRSQTSLPLLQRALKIEEKANGVEHPRVASVLAQMGKVYEELDQRREAAEFMNKALQMRERLLDKNDPEIAESLTDMANLLQDNGAFGKATPLLQRASEIIEKATSAKSPRFAASLRNLATNATELNNYAKAEPLLKRALAIDEAPGGNPSDTARDLASLAAVYVSQGKYAEAQPLYRRALEIVEKSSGGEHPDVASCLNNEAWLYSNQSKFAESRALVERALQMREKALGQKHPAVARNLVNLALLLREQGKLEESESILKRALDIQEDSLGADHEETINTVKSLGDLYWQMKRFSDAETMFKRLLTVDETVEGKDSAAVADDLDMLAKTLVAQKRSDEATEFRKRAAEIKEKLPGAVPEGQDDSSTHGLYIKSLRQSNNFSRPVRDKWALVIGISSFRDPSINLKYAAKDAVDFRNYLVNEANFKADHVKLLTDKAATREGIVSALGDGWLQKVAQKDDMVVIYVSSHGSGAKRHVGNANFIVAYETNPYNVVLSGIPMQWLTAGVNDVVPSDRVVLILDVCHGGAVSPLTGEEGAEGGPKDRDSKGIYASGFKPRTVSVGNGQIVLTSSDAEQLSWESKTYANGVFTRQLIDALRSKKDRTTITDAFKIMKENVEQEVLRDRSHIQTPLMIRQAWSGPDLVLAVVPTANFAKQPPAKAPVKKGSLTQPVASKSRLAIKKNN